MWLIKCREYQGIWTSDPGARVGINIPQSATEADCSAAAAAGSDGNGTPVNIGRKKPITFFVANGLKIEEDRGGLAEKRPQTTTEYNWWSTARHCVATTDGHTAVKCKETLFSTACFISMWLYELKMYNLINGLFCFA